jgi:hypothetical protein
MPSEISENHYLIQIFPVTSTKNPRRICRDFLNGTD